MPFFYSLIAVGVAWAVAIWLIYPIIRPGGEITTRLLRGVQFAAYAATGIFGVIATRAIAAFDNPDRWIAVVVLPPLAWLVAFFAGLIVGPTRVTPPQKVTPEIRWPSASIDSRQPSEQDWAAAAAELASPDRRPGVWAKVFAESNGNDSAARAAYLRVRAEEISRSSKVKKLVGRDDV